MTERYKPRQPALEPRWGFVQDVYLPVYEDAPDHPDGESLFAPPSRVLSVSVVGERAFLSVRKYEETHDTTTTTAIVSECVSAEALLHALVMQMEHRVHPGHLAAALRRAPAHPRGVVVRACVCGHVPAHHDKRKSIPQGLMADYKVIWGCGWTGCGCPRYVEQPAVTGGSAVSPASQLAQSAPYAPDALDEK